MDRKEAEELLAREMRRSPILKQLLDSEDAQIYVRAFDPSTSEGALKAIQELPFEKRYTRRVFWALQWAFADFDSESVKLDLPNIPVSVRSEMLQELERRLWQMLRFIETIRGSERA
jgi:hypothetical protein